MDDQDRVSQASSVATISYFPITRESDGKLQTFGKRCQASKRDPNCPVVIRGWLNKKDSTGLKLWKRRWFVLSNYCLFYYKDSREESVLGSIPLPSYKILFCTPRECKNRKFTFKVVHQGMRSYYFSADTQEDMLGWVRALSQSASMETDSSMHRRYSSYQDFTQIGGSSESVDLPKSPSDEETCPKPRQVSRTLSEPSHLSGGRIVTSNAEQRGRRRAQRNTSPSARTPSPWGPNWEGDSLPFITSATHVEIIATGALASRSQLGSRPHTPVGRVDVRPRDDSVSMPDTLYYTPASPKTEFKSVPTTPVTERWQKPSPIYGSVHHAPTGRRPLAKSFSAGVHTDLLPPLPPSSRGANAHHPPHQQHHHRSHLSSPKVDPPPIRPLESDADAVLTRLCGCDKLLQSLSVELSQLQMDKDSVQCALEVLRLQLEDWSNQGLRAHEDALTQKALLQEELVTIRARMCDVSLEMEVVWSQYERMESELSVFRSHLQHICNFGMPQEQSQAQRELWMMEDILAGLNVNRDHFRFLLGLQKHHMFESSGPHPGSPGSPTEMPHSLPIQKMEQEPPVRPPLPQELLQSIQSRSKDLGWTESPHEGIYTAENIHRRGKSQPDLLNVKAHKDASASQSSTKGITADTASQTSKKMKMSEEEQMERMKRNQERMTNRKKPPIPSPAAKIQTQTSEMQKEGTFPLRVTRVVTAVLPSSLVARRVSVEDPPPELDAPLPEQISSEAQGRVAERSKKSRTARPTQASAEKPQENLVMKAGRLASRSSEPESDVSKAVSAKASRKHVCETSAGQGDRHSSEIKADERPSSPDLCLTPEQREAKLRRVERIRQRVIQSAITPIKQEGHLRDTSGKQRATSDYESNCHMKTFRTSLSYVPPEAPIPGAISQVENNQNQHVDNAKTPIKFLSRTQHKSYSHRAGVATKIKRPPSPHHITSMTVYQKDAGEGFLSCKEDDKQEVHEPDGDEVDDGNNPSSDLRSKWFLSTNHRLEFLPLHIPDIDISTEETSRKEDRQPASSDDGNDSSMMSSAVSQSLEKMKENHSLFYKIACDISISDTDITKKENSREELVITECVVRSASDQESENFSRKLPSDTELVDALRSYIEETKHGAPPQDTAYHQALDCDREGNGGTKKSEERSSGQDRCKENKDTAGDQENLKTSFSSGHRDKGVGRRDSYQKAKVTVFRTSL
ncbi:pleckstrin homology domain-containing family A member 6 [Phycodurus eques]|uniref:pleckstrin homology domain-containing family A member 6 n=1 Tax=Phycodurus eques TaxID=693459 RepID=UPI002ACDF0A8|nr:pleckstrin homology domain-containing family A member 6 [Phycodurus eques]XP_061562244.1 pleckstrin homology domain-containing family A member 6 [Phycodurus eques]